MIRHPLVGALLLAFALPALAQDDFTGQFELEGKYSNRRATAVDLKITETLPQRFVVSRTAKFTSRRYRKQPAFTWNSSETRRQGSLLFVRYEIGPDAAGIIDRLQPGSSDRAILGALAEGNVFRAIYILSSDKKSLKEVLYNTTRSGSDAWWRWAKTGGDRKTPPAKPKLTSAGLDRAVTKHIKEWYLEMVDEAYEDDLADASTAAERKAVLESREIDREFDNTVELFLGDDTWEEYINEDYEDGNPFRDEFGRDIKREDVMVYGVSFAPEFAGIGLSKVFVFHRQTGELLDESDIMD
jgi:hypothetical protein